jgi:hypothetical protein
MNSDVLLANSGANVNSRTDSPCTTDLELSVGHPPPETSHDLGEQNVNSALNVMFSGQLDWFFGIASPQIINRPDAK